MEEKIDSNELFKNELIAGQSGEECKPNLDDQEYSHLSLEPQTFEEGIKPSSISYCDKSGVKIEQFVIKKEDNEIDDFQTLDSVQNEPIMKLNVENNFDFDSIEYDSSNDNQEIKVEGTIENFDDCDNERTFKNDEDPKTFNDFVTESATGEDSEATKGSALFDRNEVNFRGESYVHEKIDPSQSSFAQAEDLKRHFQSVNEKKHSYVCTECTSTFAKARGLGRHAVAIHGKRRAHQCLQCSSSFSEAEKLKTHIKVVHEKWRPHACLMCKSSFAANWALKRHIKCFHENVRFNCPLCNYGFTQKCSLDRHINSVHEKKRPYNCPQCNSSFSQRSSLKIHIQAMHKKLRTDV